MRFDQLCVGDTFLFQMHTPFTKIYVKTGEEYCESIVHLHECGYALDEDVSYAQFHLGPNWQTALVEKVIMLEIPKVAI